MTALLVHERALLSREALASRLEELALRLGAAQAYYLGLHPFTPVLEETAGDLFRLRHEVGAHDLTARYQLVSAVTALRAQTCQCDQHQVALVVACGRLVYDAARRVRKADQW